MDHSNLETVIFAGEIVNANAQLQLMGIDVAKSIREVQAVQ